jgi:hypothetical protein
MAMSSPEAVAMSTSPMAAESFEGSPMPLVPRVAKALIMPKTVPSSPIIGVQTPITER